MEISINQYRPNMQYVPRQSAYSKTSPMNCDSVLFTSKYRYLYDRHGSDWRRKAILFEVPTTLKNAFKIIKNDKYMQEEFSCFKRYPQKTISNIQNELETNTTLRDTRVTGMIDFGRQAFVFEREDGKVLKITKGDHFLGRKVEDFDLPIIEGGRIVPKSNYYYYVEEKVSSNNVPEDKIKGVINLIKSKGYRLCDGIGPGNLRANQFGLATDENVYLIDPECARSKNFLLTAYKKLSRFVNDVIS
ncbi:MAG: hypothetical protein K6E29_08895 [Cyanobacteria bacterium RUI128]|nr:hypothetical protein [Cyanobacteria bacterium RUI128]